MSPVHVLVVSQCFYPESFRINDICQEWVRRGYRVTVLTGIPNYPQGRFYYGYNWFRKRRETYMGIDIIRIPLIPRGHNALMLALNYFSFMLSGFFWSWFTRLKADVVFTIGLSPLMQVLPGIWYARKHKTPCYIHVQDLWPDNVVMMTGIRNKLFVGWIDRMMDRIYSRCHRIFTASNSFITAIHARGIPLDKLEYWPQYAEDAYRPMEKKNLPDIPSETFTVLFAGNIGYAQGLEILPQTARMLREQNVFRPICFVIIGDGRYKEKLMQQVRDLNVEAMFRFIPRQPSEEIPYYLAACDVALLSLASSPIYEMTIPAKLQSHMACGVPTVAAAAGETRQIITESKSGVCVDPGNSSQLAGALISLAGIPEKQLRQMGEYARQYYLDHYQKDLLFDRMDAYLRQRVED